MRKNKIKELIFSTIWFVLAGFYLFDTDNDIGFWACLILSNIYSSKL